MRRRDFLASSLVTIACEALSIGMALPRTAGAAPRDSGRLVDAHCHIFNAADLPVDNFIKRVVLRKTIDDLKKKNSGYAKLFEAYRSSIEVMLHMLGSAVTKQSPGPDAEILILDRMEQGVAPPTYNSGKRRS